MSYNSTKCPCGSKKETETMLCPECEQTFAGSHDRQRMDDPSASWSSRRGAAIRLLAQSRRRRGGLNLEAAA